MPWMGSKSSARKDGNGVWIASLLPPIVPNQLYVEPFAGMLGILLQRQRATYEIANDIDGRVVNWWRVVREQPEALARLIAYMPHSRAEFEAAHARITEDPARTGLDAALDFTVITLQSLTRGNAGSGWIRDHGPAGRRTDWSAGLQGRIDALAQRLRRVQLECGDAIPLIEQTARHSHAVLYCDPPYSGTTGYAHSVDRDALRDALLTARASVAISGDGDEWDHLGWRKETRNATVLRGATGSRRRETLWMNYDPVYRLV